MIWVRYSKYYSSEFQQKTAVWFINELHVFMSSGLFDFVNEYCIVLAFQLSPAMIKIYADGASFSNVICLW